jgi:hypothetical protein
MDDKKMTMNEGWLIDTRLKNTRIYGISPPLHGNIAHTTEYTHPPASYVFFSHIDTTVFFVSLVTVFVFLFLGPLCPLLYTLGEHTVYVCVQRARLAW